MVMRAQVRKKKKSKNVTVLSKAGIHKFITQKGRHLHWDGCGDH